MRKPRSDAKPTALRLIQGNPSKRPVNSREPKPSRELPDPPEHLTTDAAIEWMRTVEELDRLGIMTTLDMAVFALYCQAWGRWVAAERMIEKMARSDPSGTGLLIKSKSSGDPIPNPLVGVSRRAAADVIRYACEFGMTPSARSRIQAGPVDSGSKFDGLLA